MLDELHGFAVSIFSMKDQHIRIPVADVDNVYCAHVRGGNESAADLFMGRQLCLEFGNLTDLLPELSSFIRRVCSGYAPVWGVLRTQSV